MTITVSNNSGAAEDFPIRINISDPVKSYNATINSVAASNAERRTITIPFSGDIKGGSPGASINLQTGPVGTGPTFNIEHAAVFAEF